MRNRAAQAVLAAIAAVTILGGCAVKPLVSDAEQWDSATLDEQRDWVAAQTDEAIAVLGKNDGWWEYDPSYRWPEQRKRIMREAETVNCRPNQGFDQPSSLRLILNNMDFKEPFAAAARLKQHWIDEGWTVTYVIDPEEAPVPEEYFRADREDGAVMSLDAYENLVVLEIDSSCSDDPSVVYRY